MNAVFIYPFIAAIFALAYLGYCFLPALPNEKLGRISKPELLVICFGFGTFIIIIYGYVLDFFTGGLGLVPLNPFLVLDCFPCAFATLWMYLKFKMKVGRSIVTWKFLWAKMHSVLANGKSLWSKVREELRAHSRELGVIIILFVIGGVLIAIGYIGKIYDMLESSPFQVDWDGIIWQGNIDYYYNSLQINYHGLGTYSAAFVIISTFFLAFNLGAPFSSQYSFMKYFPFMTLFLLFFIMYLIFRRISITKNPIYFIAGILLLFSSFFFFRFCTLLPSPVQLVLVAIIILMLFIPDIPRYLFYILLGTAPLIHPITGILMFLFYLGYRLYLILLVRFKLNINMWPEHYCTMKKEKIFKTLKPSVVNLIAFLLPLGIIIICTSIRWTPQWILDFTGFFNSSAATTSGLVNSPLIIPFHNGFSPQDWAVFISNMNWLNSSGWSPFSWIWILIVAIPTKYYNLSSEKEKILGFFKFVIIVGLLFWLMPVFSEFLSFITPLPYGTILYNFILSSNFVWISSRVFELIIVIGAIMTVVFLERVFSIWNFIFKLDSTLKLQKKRYLEIIHSTSVFVLIFIVNSSFIPITEYVYNSDYASILLPFRDYLDKYDPGPKLIAYNPGDEQFFDIVYQFMPSNFIYKDIYYNYSTEREGPVVNITFDWIDAHFNFDIVRNSIQYLILDRIPDHSWINDSIWAQLSATDHTLFHNSGFMVLKFD